MENFESLAVGNFDRLVAIMGVYCLRSIVRVLEGCHRIPVTAMYMYIP